MKNRISSSVSARPSRFFWMTWAGSSMLRERKRPAPSRIGAGRQKFIGPSANVVPAEQEFDEVANGFVDAAQHATQRAERMWTATLDLPAGVEHVDLRREFLDLGVVEFCKPRFDLVAFYPEL